MNRDRNVVTLSVRAPGRLLTKRELARELGRSKRWIELRMREGLPVQSREHPGEHARYDLVAVREWLDRRPAQPVVSLEQVVAELRERVAQLEQTIEARHVG